MTFDVRDVDDQKLIEQAADMVNNDYLDYVLVKPELAHTEAGRQALHDIMVRGYHKEEAAAGLL